MKPSLLCFVTISFLIFIISCKHPVDKTEETNFAFIGDSGYISDAELFRKIKFDTVNNKDTLYKMINIHSGDTVGKYYKGNNGHYFSCLNASHGFVGFLLVETKPDGTIITKAPYGVSINGFCWNSDYDGFRKYGDYLSFRSCSSGTAQSSGAITLFKTLKPQEEMGEISESLWYSNYDDTYNELTSKIEIKNDTVFMHYTATAYTEVDDKKVINTTDTFTIRYVAHGDEWAPLERSPVTMQF